MIQASSNSARLVAEDRVRMTGAVTTRGGTAAGGQHRVFIELRAGDCCPTQRGVDTVDTGHWTLAHTGHPNIAVTGLNSRTTWPPVSSSSDCNILMGSLHAHNQLLTISHYFR